MAAIPSADHLGGTDGEERVGGFGLCVGKGRVVAADVEIDVGEIDRRIQVRPGAEGHDPGPACSAQRRQQPESQPEVAEVVGGELHFVALGAPAQFRYGHHPGVVDQDVQRTVELGDQAVDRAAIEQVQRCDMHCRVARPCPDALCRPFRSCGVPGRDDDLRAGSG